MYSKGYVQLNRYFAFVFVVFAVISGISDHYDEDNSTKAKDERLAYFWNIGHLLAQNPVDITTQILINKYTNFGDYVKAIVVHRDAHTHILTAFLFSSIFFAGFCLNNQIMQNNIWRKAVF